MPYSADLVTQLTAALRFGEARVACRIERTLYGSLPTWVVAELIEQLEAAAQPPDSPPLPSQWRNPGATLWEEPGDLEVRAVGCAFPVVAPVSAPPEAELVGERD
jgi:hypothetical protein